MLVNRIPAGLISLLICRQSPCAGDMTLRLETVCTETVSEIEIYNISVRIVETKFARTDVPESTSARVLESLESCYSPVCPRPPKKGWDPKSGQEDEGEYAALDGLLTSGTMRRGGSLLCVKGASQKRKDAREGLCGAWSATLIEMDAGGPKNSLKQEMGHE